MLEAQCLYRQDMLDQCAEAITSLENVNDKISKLQEKILAFVEDETLQSQKIAGAKAHFYNYCQLLNQLKKANELDKANFDALQTEIGNNVTEDLCGDYLVPEQKRAHDEYIDNSNKADEYAELANNAFLQVINPGMCTYFASMSVHYNRQASDWFALADELQQKMNLYDAVEYKTKALFGGESERIRAGIHDQLVRDDSLSNMLCGENTQIYRNKPEENIDYVDEIEHVVAGFHMGINAIFVKEIEYPEYLRRYLEAHGYFREDEIQNI